MPAQHRSLQLLVSPLTQDLHVHDQAFAGIYPAMVAASAANDQAARAVIDAFFQDHQPRHPDDFCYQVFDGLLPLTEADHPGATPIAAYLGARQARA